MSDITTSSSDEEKAPAESVDAAVQPGGEKGGKQGWLSGVMEFVVAFAIMLLAILALRTWVVEPFEIPSGSMLQTIQIGDRVFAEKITTALSDMPEPGEIVTFTCATALCMSTGWPSTSRTPTARRPSP